MLSASRRPCRTVLMSLLNGRRPIVSFVHETSRFSIDHGFSKAPLIGHDHRTIDEVGFGGREAEGFVDGVAHHGFGVSHQRPNRRLGDPRQGFEFDVVRLSVLSVLFGDPSADLDELQTRTAQIGDGLPQAFCKYCVADGDDVVVFGQVKFLFYRCPVFVFGGVERPETRVDAGVEKVRINPVNLFDSVTREL